MKLRGNPKNKTNSKKNRTGFSEKELYSNNKIYFGIVTTGAVLLLSTLIYIISKILTWEKNIPSQNKELLKGMNSLKNISARLVIFAIILFIIITLLIISQEKDKKKIFQLAYYDNLTKLPNRRFFEDILQKFIEESEKFKQKVGLVYIDLDNFKVVNDTLSHTVGDGILRQVGDLIKGTLRQSDMVCRFEGDEFVVLLPGISGRNDAMNIVKRMINILQAPFISNEKKFYITASMGIAIYPDDAEDIDTILQYSNMAMNRAKENGKNTYSLFESHMNIKLLEKYELEEDLRQAIKKQELILYYQPQIDIKTGKMVGVEALIRWNHPTKGLIPPMKFIPLAEETGLIIPIGEWVLRTACSQSSKWTKKGFENLRISVNLSAKQFQQPDLVEMIVGILKETNMRPELLDLEITESVAMMDLDLTKRVLQHLRSKKINISLDDFGTGYSSLNYLKQLPINTVKIDKTFVDNITDDVSQQTIAKAVIDLSHNMDLYVTAEGVETWEQFTFLKFQKCDKVQGYLFSTPLPLDEIEKIISQDKGFIEKSN
ncbi:MAG: EAL domain-containing protein [Epulopiscium sp.]|nr:EAL domain-containing protein [Candidatus Epulonipiscium sp.]